MFVDSLVLIIDSLLVAAGSFSEVLVSLMTVTAALFVEASLVDEAV